MIIACLSERVFDMIWCMLFKLPLLLSLAIYAYPNKLLTALRPSCILRVKYVFISLMDESRGSFIKPLRVDISCAGGQSIEWLSAMV